MASPTDIWQDHTPLSWKRAFAKAAGLEPKIAYLTDEHRMATPPQIEYHEAENQTYGYHGNDRPFVYNGLTHKIYMGGVGDYHGDVSNDLWGRAKTLATEWNDAYNNSSGHTPWSGAENLHGTGRVGPEGIYWYTRPDYVEPQINKTLQEHFNSSAFEDFRYPTNEADWD